jgi:hypothetical protein
MAAAAVVTSAVPPTRIARVRTNLLGQDTVCNSAADRIMLTLLPEVAVSDRGVSITWDKG